MICQKCGVAMERYANQVNICPTCHFIKRRPVVDKMAQDTINRLTQENNDLVGENNRLKKNLSRILARHKAELTDTIDLLA